MKLLRLKIDERFRSLQAGFELEFLQTWDRDPVPTNESFDFAPYILAGPNGSGKSNVLEVLAAIFYQLECQYLNYLPEVLQYQGEDDDQESEGGQDEEKNEKYQELLALRSPKAFELEYLISVPDYYRIAGADATAHIRVFKEKGSEAKMYWLNQPSFGAGKPLPRMQSKELLPNFVLGYSSGENEVLSLPFFKMRFINYDEYTDRLFNQYDYEGKPEGRMVYLDASFSQAIVISNLLLQDREVLLPFSEELGVEDIKSFRIIIRKASGVDFNGEFFEGYSQSDVDESGSQVHILTEYLDKSIDALKRCATCTYETEEDEIYLDYLVNEATREAFRLHFGRALDLFQVFQIMLTLNLYTVSSQLKKELYTSDSLYVSETVPVLASDQRIMRFKHVDLQKRGVSKQVTLKSLSDGEHQFLHALGLCLLYRDDNALFLLDEPDTHFNPPWRAQFISRLRECFENDRVESKSPEVLITTHSPFLISDSEPENVLEFKKDKVVAVERPKYNTLGASVDQITILTFDKAETIGGYAEGKLKALQRRFESGEDKNGLIKEIKKQLGDSVEKMALMRNILDSMNEGDG